MNFYQHNFFRFINVRRVNYTSRFVGCGSPLMFISAVLPLSMRAKLMSIVPLTTLQLAKKERRRFCCSFLSYRAGKSGIFSSFLWNCFGGVQLSASSGVISTALAKITHLYSRRNDNTSKNNNENGSSNQQQNSSDSSQEEADNDDFLVERSVFFVLVMFLISYILYRLEQPTGKHTGWTSLTKHVDNIKSIHIYPNYAQVYLEEAKVYLGLVDDQHTNEKIEQLRTAYIVAKIQEKSNAQQQKQLKAKDGEKKGADLSPDLEVVMHGTPLAEKALVGLGVFAWVIPFVFFPVFVMILSSSIGKSLAATMEAGKKSQKLKDMVFRVEHTSNTRFHHIAGMKEAKKEITEIVHFLRSPERYTTLGAKVPRGALLLGPPGTGKTLLAKAVAGESGVGFIPVCGSDFVELYVGMGALRVRQLFETAKKQRCIIYIDEIDAIGLKRSGAGHGEKQEQERTLNELLTQLDGFNTAKAGDVMILASSNVAQEMLDPALIRPGRFDRIIHVDPPVISERIDIFKVHLSSLKLVIDSEKKDGVAKDLKKNVLATDTCEKESVATNETEKIKQESQLSATTVITAKSGEDVKGNGTCQAANDDFVDAKRTDKESSAAVAVKTDVSAPVTTSFGNEAFAPTSTSADGDVTNVTETQLTVCKLEEKEEVERPSKENERGDDISFDFEILLKNKNEHERRLINIYAERMSGLCPGFVGSDIANVCNEGAILAAREGCKFVDITHLERSIDRVIAGIEHRSRVLTPFERNVVAHHEAGHAVAGWFLNCADPLMKVSIVPRGGSALGYAQYLPNENTLRTAREIRDAIGVTLGGRVAEKIFFNHLSTGASDDLRKVAQMAYQYVTSFAQRPVYSAPGTEDTRFVKPFGATISNELDVEAKKLVDEIYESTYSLLLARKKEMETLARHLLEKEVLTYNDVVKYLGARAARTSDRKKGV